MSRPTRRQFIHSAGAVSAVFAALPLIGSHSHARSLNAHLELLPDAEGLLDLPEGFSYSVVSREGGRMSDGFFRPGRPDGMACFAYPGDAGKCVLVRNHENWPDTLTGSPFGEDGALAARLRPEQVYDRKQDGSPFIGGTTTVVYDLKKGRMEADFLSLAGTTGNCAGGATPWGSWLSCEESDITTADGAGKPHGFVFEVSSAARGPVEAVPLEAMGRFTHEATAIDPATGVIYLTEDALAGLFYRFLPAEPGNLRRGGRLQALAIEGWRSADMRNWPLDWGSAGAGGVEVGREHPVRWIDLKDVSAPQGDLAERGYAAGAARFCRGEGMAYGRREAGGAGEVFFNCTQGGAARTGQVWRYRPSPHEATHREAEARGRLTLVYESRSADHLDLCDNLAIAPQGDLILCEDGLGDNYLRGLTLDGEIYDIARNAHPQAGEFCGACFSPDGSVMFVNIQEPGITLAVEGPWRALKV